MRSFFVLYYKDGHDRSEVLDFILKSNARVKSKIQNQVKHLEEFGLSRANPYIRKLTNTPFWEVRILGKDNIRLFCANVESNIIIFHIFLKKKQKTPISEIKTALMRYTELVDK